MSAATVRMLTDCVDLDRLARRYALYVSAAVEQHDWPAAQHLTTAYLDRRDALEAALIGGAR